MHFDRALCVRACMCVPPCMFACACVGVRAFSIAVNKLMNACVNVVDSYVYDSSNKDDAIITPY